MISRKKRVNRKKDWTRWGLLTGGLVLGALAMAVYLYPAFFLGSLETSADVESPKIRGEVKAATSNWSEDWTITAYRTLVMTIPGQACTGWLSFDRSIGIDYPSRAQCRERCREDPRSECVSSTVDVEGTGYQRCMCKCCPQSNYVARFRLPQNGSLALGPSKWRVTGQIDGRQFVENWEGRNWINADYNQGVRSGLNNFPYKANFSTENSSANIHRDAATDKDRTRLIFSLGDYGYLNVVNGNYERFRPDEGNVEGGGSWPATWHVEGGFTD